MPSHDGPDTGNHLLFSLSFQTSHSVLYKSYIQSNPFWSLSICSFVHCPHLALTGVRISHVADRMGVLNLAHRAK